MTIHVPQQEPHWKPWVDRSGIRHDHGREGFVFVLDDVAFEFEDEADVVKLAKACLERLGER